jgi:DNA topoisomerase-2
VETVDSKKGLKYTQQWKNNMSVKGDPVIENIPKDSKGSADYTRVTFTPDLSKFRMNSLKEGTLYTKIKQYTKV